MVAALLCSAVVAVRFSTGDIAAFAAWSSDQNPLHVDDRFASQTHFGRPVVHGVLSALAALRGSASFSSGPGREFDVEFRHAVVPDVEYRVREQRDDDELVLSMEDSGGQRVLTLRVRSGSASGPLPSSPSTTPSRSRCWSSPARSA